jgi:hypothetical protein
VTIGRPFFQMILWRGRAPSPLKRRINPTASVAHPTLPGARRPPRRFPMAHCCWHRKLFSRKARPLAAEALEDRRAITIEGNGGGIVRRDGGTVTISVYRASIAKSACVSSPGGICSQCITTTTHPSKRWNCWVSGYSSSCACSCTITPAKRTGSILPARVGTSRGLPDPFHDAASETRGPPGYRQNCCAGT